MAFLLDANRHRNSNRHLDARCYFHANCHLNTSRDDDANCIYNTNHN